MENKMNKYQKNPILEEIIEIIETHPEQLETLSMDKLEVIDDYYDNEISKLKKSIERIKKFA